MCLIFYCVFTDIWYEKSQNIRSVFLMVSELWIILRPRGSTVFEACHIALHKYPFLNSRNFVCIKVMQLKIELIGNSIEIILKMISKLSCLSSFARYEHVQMAIKDANGTNSHV